MKRNPDGNSMGPQKRFRGSGGGGGGGGGAGGPGGPEEPCLRLLIPSKVAGSIIGKGGKNISRLRTTYKATVSLPDCPGPERVVIVGGGADLETAVKVVEDIVPNLEEYFRNQGKSEADVRVLVHQSLAGCVIGKQGAKIKELREKTGAKIKIFGNCCPQSTDRVISIVGSVQVCSDAIKEVVELIKATPTKGFSEPYDPRNFDEEYSEEYGGFGVAPGPRVWESPPSLGSGGPMGGGGGGPPPPPRGGLRGPPPPPLGAPPGGPRGPPRGGPPPPPLAPQEPPNGAPMRPGTTQVTIPKDLAGAIIGKGGTRIRKIRSDSGADITIDEPIQGSNDRIITITGNPDQVHLAQYFLQQTVLESQRMGNRF